MNFLINKTEVFRCPTEEEAKTLLQQIKNSNAGEVVKYSLDNKNAKAKGEIVDEWIELTVKREYNNKKDPITPLENYTF